MGFYEVFKGNLLGAVRDTASGVLADQWLEFFTVPDDVAPTAAIFPAQLKSQNAGRGANTGGSTALITNGSKIIVPEGYALVTFQDGAVSGLITQPGGYVYTTDQNASATVLEGDWKDALRSTWERFKFGGRPAAQQLAFFVNLKEIPNNKFGTQSEIYWDDAFLGTQAGAIARGSYSLQIVDPLLFIRSMVPQTYLNEAARPFDLADMNNPAGEQLFNEVVGSLAGAFSRYTNDPARNHRITGIQSDSVGFAQALSAQVEDDYQWATDRGLRIVKVTLTAIEYDAKTRELITEVQKADALGGARGNAYMQQSVARGMQAAGENGGAGAMFGMGMAGGAAGGLMQGMQQPGTPPQGYQAPQQGAPAAAQQAPAAAAPAEDPVAKLKQMKELLDAGILTQEEFDAAKAKFLAG